MLFAVKIVMWDTYFCCHLKKLTQMLCRYVLNGLAWNRVPTPQGKQGNCCKVIPDRENTGNLKFWKDKGNLKNFCWKVEIKKVCAEKIVA